MYQVFLSIQYLGILVLVLEIMFIFSRKPSKIQRDMLFFAFCLLIIFIAYTAEMKSENLAEAMMAVKFGYIGKPYLVLAMLFLILNYCDIHIPYLVSALLVAVQSVFPLLVFTYERNGLFYTTAEFVEEGVFPHVVVGHGIAYQLFAVDMLIYVIAMLIICFGRLNRTQSRTEKNQLFVFASMIDVAFISFALVLTDIFQGYDCTLPGYLFATLGFSFSFFRLNLMDTISLAKEQAFDYIQCGMLVFDNKNELLYQNETAERMHIAEKAEKLVEKAEPFPFGGKMYEINKQAIEKDGQRFGYMYFLQDMTAHYDHERQLERDKERADAVNEAKSRFLSSMSHDIRTPMNVILGMTKIAMLHLDNKVRVKDCLDKVEMSGQHLLGLINEVLDMSKIESGKLELNMEPFDMGRMFDEILLISKSLTDSKSQTLITDLAGVKNRGVYGDKSRLSQVIMNLLSNASKYTNRGGKIWFYAKESVDGAFSDYTFIVRDTGIGMSEEFLPTLFDPFSRADDDKVKNMQGAGLGLAISKQIVDVMGGQIQVSSKRGKGTTFTVMVRLQHQDLQHKEEHSDHVPEVLKNGEYAGKRILLVEDYELNAEIASEIFGMLGIEVELASNGKQAVEKIVDCEDGDYDMIFMDILMPEMDGLKAAKAIRTMDREYAKKVPIIAMSANAFAEDVKSAKEAGMNGHIAKPLDMSRLMDVLKKWLG